MFDLKAYPSASLEHQENTTHVVSLWYIPGGTNYHAAKATYVFFSDKEAASSFTKKWDAPPEAPIMLTIQQHDEIQHRMASEEQRRQEQEALYA